MELLQSAAGVYDPLLIGDKPKWYSNQLNAVYFQVFGERTALASALVEAQNLDEENTGTGNTVHLSF